MKKTKSLKKNEEFQNIYKNGLSHSDRIMVMYVLENKKDFNRVGISISKKVGNSVIRHRLKRLVWENYRINEDEFVKGKDIVIIMRYGSGQSDFYKIKKSLIKLSKIHHIINTEYEKNFDD